MKRIAEVSGNRGLELESFACHWMVKRQSEGMQTHTAAGVILVAVFSITHHRVTDVGHVHSNLVFAAR